MKKVLMLLIVGLFLVGVISAGNKIVSIDNFTLDKKFDTLPAKSSYKVSFVVVKPTNSIDYDFKESELKEVINEMNSFWSEMSHGKTNLVYDGKYDVDFPGEITCLKPSICPESWPDQRILVPKFEELNLNSDLIVALVDADVLDPYAVASKSFEMRSAEKEGEWGMIYNFRPWSVIFASSNLFVQRETIQDKARTISHEFFHTSKFLEARDTYLSSPRLIQNLPAEEYSITSDLMGGDGASLASYKRAALGWEGYQDILAYDSEVELDIKPTCLSGKAYRIPLGISKNPSIEWFKANPQDSVFYHSFFIEWVGNDACSWDKSEEGIRITEVYEKYNYFTKRLNAVYEREMTMIPNDFSTSLLNDDFTFDKISFKILERKEDTMKIAVKSNLPKENFTNDLTGELIGGWENECYVGKNSSERKELISIGIDYTSDIGTLVILQEKGGDSFSEHNIGVLFDDTGLPLLDAQGNKIDSFVVWIGKHSTPFNSIFCFPYSHKPGYAESGSSIPSEFIKQDTLFDAILLDSLGNYYSFNFEDIVDGIDYSDVEENSEDGLIKKILNWFKRLFGGS